MNIAAIVNAYGFYSSEIDVQASANLVRLRLKTEEHSDILGAIRTFINMSMAGVFILTYSTLDVYLVNAPADYMIINNIDGGVEIQSADISYEIENEVMETLELDYVNGELVVRSAEDDLSEMMKWL